MIDRELLKNAGTAWRDMFNRYVGHGREFSVEELADLSGISKQTLYSISSGKHSPRYKEMIKLLRVLPLGATEDVLRPLGLGVHMLTGEGCDFATSAALAATLAELTHALLDKRVDHQERARIEPLARHAKEELEKWLNGVQPNIFAIPTEGKVS